MATGSGQELDLTRLVVIVLFLIAGGLSGRTFFHNYVSEPARAVDCMISQLEKMREVGPSMIPPMIPPGPMGEYVTTDDEEAKRQVSRDAKRHSRAKHSLVIWGSLAVACISIIIVVSVGLPMLRERRA